MELVLDSGTEVQLVLGSCSEGLVVAGSSVELGSGQQIVDEAQVVQHRPR